MGLALVGSPDEPGPSRKDIAGTLRAIADDIEAGTLGQVVEAVVVTQGGGVHVFALGQGDPASAHLLLGAAQQKLQQSVL